MTDSIVSIIASIIAIGVSVLAAIALLPFFFSMLNYALNPSQDHLDSVVQEGANTIVNSATPWWLPLLYLGPIGAIIIIGLLYFNKNR